MTIKYIILNISHIEPVSRSVNDKLLSISYQTDRTAGDCWDESALLSLHNMAAVRPTMGHWVSPPESEKGMTYLDI